MRIEVERVLAIVGVVVSFVGASDNTRRSNGLFSCPSHKLLHFSDGLRMYLLLQDSSKRFNSL